MKKTRFIVIAGKKQAGKSYASRHIKNRILDARVRVDIDIVSFAYPIKEFCQTVMGLSQGQVYGTDEEKNSLTPYKWSKLPKEILGRIMFPMPPPEYMTAREVMQIFGTDVMRNFFDYDIWASAPFRTFDGKADVVIIDDCRFPNELTMAQKYNAVTIRLDRCRQHADEHPSEKALDDTLVSDYSYGIIGDITLDGLYSRLDDILKKEGFIPNGTP